MTARLFTIVALVLLLSGPGCLVYIEPAGDDDSASDDDDTTPPDDDDDTTPPDDDDTTPPDDDGDGVSVDDGDCDDTDPLTYPGALEECDGLDNDCDGVPDNGLVLTDWAPDSDRDNYANPLPAAWIQACTAPPGFIDAGASADCVDTNPNVNPGAVEVCDGLDNNCDGTLDEGVRVTLFFDSDFDGYGGTTSAGEGCPGLGYSTTPSDCADWDAALSPYDGDGDGVSSCDGDCNDADASVVPGLDSDGDGYPACWSDCDDLSFGINPGALEACNQTDDDCDFLIDDGLSPIAVIRGADQAGANQIRTLLTNAGYCTGVALDVANLWGTDFTGYVAVIATFDTGDVNGWFGDGNALWTWLWSGAGTSGPSGALILMGTGGAALAGSLGVAPNLALSNSTSVSSGTAYVVTPTLSFWRTPSPVVVGSPPAGHPVSVHTQGFATVRALLSVPAGTGLAWADAGLSMFSIAYDEDPNDQRRTLWFWGYDLGLNLATSSGRQTFGNLVYAAAGPP